MAQEPVVAGEKSKVIPVRVNESLADDFIDLAEQRGVSRSVLMREAMRTYLEQEVAAS